MSCLEGRGLSAQFLQVRMATRDLESKPVPGTAKEKRARLCDIERMRRLQEGCHREVKEHARRCPVCRSQELKNAA